jgi:hypothetical protein
VIRSWHSNHLVLEDNHRGRQHKIEFDSVTDFDKARTWQDEDWWKFLLSGNEF